MSPVSISTTGVTGLPSLTNFGLGTGITFIDITGATQGVWWAPDSIDLRERGGWWDRRFLPNSANLVILGRGAWPASPEVQLFVVAATGDVLWTTSLGNFSYLRLLPGPLGGLIVLHGQPEPADPSATPRPSPQILVFRSNGEFLGRVSDLKRYPSDMLVSEDERFVYLRDGRAIRAWDTVRASARDTVPVAPLEAACLSAAKDRARVAARLLRSLARRDESLAPKRETP